MTQQSTTATSVRPTAEAMFDTPDELVEWVKADPRRAAETIRNLRAHLNKLEVWAFEQSWTLNPDRMGS